jgi:FlaA1/EpsC-like NDP-sugar epimerase
MLVADSIFLIFSLWFSFVLRLGDLWPTTYIYPNWWIFLIIPFISIPVLIKLGLYRSVLQHMGVKVVLTSFQAITITSLILGFLMMIFREADTPRSVIVIFWFISTMLIIVSRFIFKGFLYSWDNFVNDRKPVIVYGAGSAGAQLVESLRKSYEYAPVAFVDDDENKQGMILNYTQIYSFDSVRKIILTRKARIILLAIPSLGDNKRREILKRLSKYPVEVKILPSVTDIVNAKVSIENIREVQVEDILGREPVKPKKKLLEKNITGKIVLVTGAGGSIGSELCRQIISHKPEKLILIEHSEFNLYSIDYSLSSLKSDCELVSYLLDVTNDVSLDKIIRENNVNTIYHAAAYKHVPLVESNVLAGVYNNAIGTYNIATIASKYNVENVVLISTDKAVRPTNVMGASKRFSELILQALDSENNNTCFSMVRFGNVLDSAGSVVPLFRRQIKNGGPVTVTHADVTRYFMSIPEAVQLVLQAGAMAKGGDVFVLDMGEPIRILDLAHRMINLSGLTPVDMNNPDGDIKIKFTGLRPGEKLYEELLIGDDVIQSKHPRIMQASEISFSWKDIEESVELIKSSFVTHDEQAVLNLLEDKVSGYRSPKKSK